MGIASLAYRLLPAVLAAPLLLCSAVASAQDPLWAEKMFSETSHDFGVLARGADVRARIKITNIYNEDVHISNVRTSCGCSSANLVDPGKNLLHSHESTFIDVSMDTRRFAHHKDSNVLVTIDAPQFKEVRIPVQMYVRTDVVLTPGGVNFGLVEAGQSVTRTIDIAFAGRPDWKIKEAKVASPHLTATVEEIGRRAGLGNVGQVAVGNVGKVDYKLTVTLAPTAPAGTLREEIQLVTDDATNPAVPVLVEGRIEADITVTPETVPLGTLIPGREKTVNVVISGRKPFAIELIECDGTEGAFAVRLPQGEKPVHVLPLTVTPPAKPGPFTETFTVTIPGRPEPVVFKATGTIAAVPQS